MYMKFIKICNSTIDIDLPQTGFNVSFTNDFNIIIGGTEFPPKMLLKVAQLMIDEQAAIKKRELEEEIYECLENTFFCPDIIGKKGGIYTIGDFYVGRSINIQSRIKQHIFQAFNGTHYNKALAAKIKEYYKEQGSITVFWEECEPTDLNEAIIIARSLEYGIELVNIDFRGLSLINKN